MAKAGRDPTPPKISDKDRRTIRKCHAQLGTDNPHVRETAYNKIIEILGKHRLSWVDLPELLQDSDTASNAVDPEDDPLTETEAAPAPNINVLELVKFIIEEHIELQSEHEYIAVALWILHVYVFERFVHTPRLALLSPVRRCGKTTLLDIIQRLLPPCPRLDDTSAAQLYWMMDTHRGGPILLDEVDNANLWGNKLMRTVLNSGHRQGGHIGRIIGGQRKLYSTFCPVALAAISGIQTLPLTLIDRSIIISMQRSRKARELRRFDPNNADDIDRINVVYLHVWHWAKAMSANPSLINLDPELPAELHDRAADNWRPLIAIADSFGPYWGEVARQAALTLSHGYHYEDIAVTLLVDIRDIFNTTGASYLFSKHLVAYLHALDDSPWNQWRGPGDNRSARALTEADLAELLNPFDVKPRSIREGANTRKGYKRAWFEKIWQAYCPQDGTPAQPIPIKRLRSI
jgi:hypothetical protein